MPRIIALASIALVCAMGAAGCQTVRPEPTYPGGPTSDLQGSSREVTRIYDGDTIVLSSPRETVRMIGLNAPEREQPFYDEARDQLQQMLGDNSVQLHHDVETHDRHGRSLAYVYLPDGTHVNLEMVRLGFAQALTVPPNVAWAEAFREAQREARDAGRGLWAPSPLPLAIDGMEPDPRGPDEDNLNGEWVQVRNTGSHDVDLSGVTLSDEGNNTFTFPGYHLAPGSVVRVYSGPGHPATGALYWDHRVPVWNNGGDTALLRDAAGWFIDAHAYSR